MVSPSIRAICALRTSPTLVDCTIGNSPGFAPLRSAAASLEHRAERDAAREQSRRFGPVSPVPQFKHKHNVGISNGPLGSASGC
jgi:hypothetical protein